LETGDTPQVGTDHRDSERGTTRHRRVVIVLAVSVAVLAAVAGWSVYAMHTNEQRAASWHHRAVQLDALLAARTQTLNTRIDQMNRLAGKLKLSQTALSQSQTDVSSLEVRQRELANEKAQLEDQQRELDGVASGYITCKEDVIQLLSDVSNGYDTTYSLNVASSDCANADNALQSYLSAHPNG
jgi:TolA-binding protein